MKTFGIDRRPARNPRRRTPWRRRGLNLTRLGMVLSILSIGTPGWAAPEPEAATPGAPVFDLAEILALALERNPILTAGEGAIARQEGRRRSSEAYPNPTFSVQLGRGTVRDPSTGTSIAERYVTLRQPLEWPGMRAADQRAARAGVAGAQATLEETKLDLTAEVKRAFYRLLLAQRRQVLLAQNLATVKRLGRAVQKRVRAGDAPAFAAVETALEIRKEETALTEAGGDVQAAKAALDALTAGTLGRDFSIRGEFPSPPAAMEPDRLIHWASRHHPGLLRLRYLVEEGRELQIREEQARVPTVTVEGAYQRDAGREAVVGSLSVPFPLWDQRQGAIAQAMGELRQREARLLRAEQELAKAVKQQLQRVNTAIAQIEAYEEGFLRQAQEARRLAEVSFRFGEVSLLEVFDAQRLHRRALMDYARARYDLSIALTELERLVGGPARFPSGRADDMGSRDTAATARPLRAPANHRP